MPPTIDTITADLPAIRAHIRAGETLDDRLERLAQFVEQFPPYKFNWQTDFEYAHECYDPRKDGGCCCPGGFLNLDNHYGTVGDNGEAALRDVLGGAVREAAAIYTPLPHAIHKALYEHVAFGWYRDPTFAARYIRSLKTSEKE